MSDTQLTDQYLYQSSLKSDPTAKVSSRKRCSYIIDLNQGSYQNGIITIGATAQLNGTEGFASLRDAYIPLPYKVSMKNTHNTQAMQKLANRFSLGLKCGNWNVIDSLSVELNGKSLLSMRDYNLFWNNLRAQTEFSTDYLMKHGPESYLFPDCAQSFLYTSGTNSTSGDGYTNNIVVDGSTFGITSSPSGLQIQNDGFANRLQNNPPTANTDFTSAWPAFGNSAASTVIQNRSSRGAFVAGAAAAGSIMGSWIYMLKIKLTDLHPIFKELDLIANPQLRLRFRVNQGYSVVACDTAQHMTLSGTTLMSGQTCPIMIASAATNNPNASVLPAAAGQLTVAWGAVTNYLEPAIDGTYMPFTTARLYVPFLDLENPQSIIQKPNKTVRYNDAYAQYFYQRAGIGKQASQFNTTFDLQLSASIRNAKYVAVLPFAEATSSFASAAVQQWQSPFDSAPWTVAPRATIRNFNVKVGSQTVFEGGQDFDFWTFCNEFSKIGAINGDLTPELSNGLIDYQT